EVDLDTDSLCLRAVDRLIDRVGVDADLTSLLVHYTETKAEDDKSWKIERDIYEVAKSLFREEGMEQRESLKNVKYEDFRESSRKIRQWNEGFEKQVNLVGQQAIQLMENHQLQVSDFFQGAKGIAGFYVKLKSNKLEDASTKNAYIIQAIEEDIWTSKKQEPSICVRIEQIKPQLLHFYNEATSLLSSKLATYKLYKLLLKQLYATAVLAGIEKIVSEIKEEEKILPISEFNRIVSEVTMSEPVPFIYERIGTRFKHFMIDEFQDTSVLQWFNLLPLVDNSLASNYFNLVVGDGKQAIYRWRNGEVEQFINLPLLTRLRSEIDAERQSTLERHYRYVNLDKNYRSHKTVVEFNNNLFSFLANKLPQGMTGVYEDVNQKYRDDKPHGYVHIEFMLNNKGNAWIERQCDRVMQIVQSVIEDGYSAGDIAVLCRTNKSCALLARYLLKNEIAVISSDSLLLGSSEKVRLIMACMRLVINPADHLAYVEAISNLIKLNLISTVGLHETIVQVFNPAPDTRYKNTFDPDKFKQLLTHHGFEYNRQLLLTLNLYDLAEELIRLFGLNEPEDIYLQFFCEELHAKTMKNSLQADSLLSWWEEKGADISVAFPANIDAVKVMSIHKSKGLQFPVVIYPFASTSVSLRGASSWVDLDDPLLGNIKTAYLPYESLGNTPLAHLKEEEEDKTLLDLLNIMYVACTRPEDRLYILTQAKDSKTSEKMSVPVFIQEFIQSQDAGFEASDGSIYTFGQPYCPTGATKTADSQVFAFQEGPITIEQDSRISWKQRVVLGSQAPETWFSGNTSDARAHGSLVHRILARITSLPSAEQVLDDMLAAGEIAPELSDEFRNLLHKFAQTPVMQGIFNCKGTILPEPEIILPNGVVFRPDRIIIQPGLCQVIEFKTGSAQKKHQEQLFGYMQLMYKMGYGKVQGKLIYLDDDCRAVELSL
ncbi:MAG: 3'-5' exonuclease, partial [Bacteroidales bacterium]|nr:3'-5' exonuclease [Bacteroidales bacterium]